MQKRQAGARLGVVVQWRSMLGDVMCYLLGLDLTQRRDISRGGSFPA